MPESTLDHLQRNPQLPKHVAGGVAERVEREAFESSLAQCGIVDAPAEIGGPDRASLGSLDD